MTYTAGSTIVAADYNGFAAGNANNINAVWGVGTGTTGYGQSTTLSNVAAAATVTATQWSSLNSRITSMGSHQGTTITSRTNPVAGNTIAILANLQTDINSITTNHGNAAAQGTQNTAWTGTSSQTGNIGIVNGQTWTITFRHDVTWANASAARYFFNAGGTIKWQCSKTSTGQPADAEWNALATTECGSIFITTGGYTQNIAGTAYTGVTKSGGTGTPTTLNTGTGFNQYTTAAVEIYKQYSNIYGYTQNYINVTANVNANTNPTVLTLTTTWNGSQNDSYHPSANITGGTATTGITFGSAPATVVTYFPPDSTYLTEAVWGTPTVVATTSNTTSTTYTATYLAVGGGGGGGSNYRGGGGGGGAGGLLSSTLTLVTGTQYTLTVGAGGATSFGNPGVGGTRSTISASALQAIPFVIALGGGGGGGGSGNVVVNGGDGGSGGGAAASGVAQNAGGLGGLGTSGQGNNGGNYQVFDSAAGAGGGGAGAAGTNGGSNGGNGSSNSTSGAAVTYAGGGGGSQSGTGGTGGGGAGANGNATAGTVNLGGGGGGGAHRATTSDSPYNSNIGIGGAGGAGVIILSVPTASYSGTTTGSPTVTTSGSNTIIKYTSTGTYTA